MSDERIHQLAVLVKQHRDAYYNLEPKISDQEYDSLVDELQKLSPAHAEVKAVGAAAPKYSVWEKVAHKIPMGSLNKANSEKEFIEWVSSTGSKVFLITHKIDGSSMELVYQGGKLVRAVTRGDGSIGEDVTSNIKNIPSIPNSFESLENYKGEITIRGEVVMFKKVFKEKYSDTYANPRNTAAGKVRDKKGGGEDCKNLSFLAYGIHSDGVSMESEVEQFMILEKLGFQVPYYACGDIEAVVRVYNKVAEDRESIPYEIDGMVIRVQGMKEQDALGSLNMRPKGQIAWKFDPAMGITQVLDIKWQVGNSGRITPVASVAPVNVGGVSITSVSLHNISMFRDLKLFLNCRVLISRRNDVIPFLERNLDVDQLSE